MKKLNKKQYLKKVKKQIGFIVKPHLNVLFLEIVQKIDENCLSHLINGEGISFKDNERPLIGVATIKS